MSEREVVCFHCTQPIGDPPRLNELADGQVCPACRDRLLEELPPIVHSPVRAGAAAPQGDAEGATDGAGSRASTRGPRLVVDEPATSGPAEDDAREGAE